MAKLTVVQSNRPEGELLEVLGTNDDDGSSWRAVCPNGETIEVEALSEDTIIGLTKDEQEQLTDETEGE